MTWWQQLLISSVGGLIGGGFALTGVHLSSRRSADAERRRFERDELVRLAADLIRFSDATWVATGRVSRASFVLSRPRSGGDGSATAHADQEWKAAHEEAWAADAGGRVTVALLRLAHPTVATEAEALWRASKVTDHLQSFDDKGRRDAEEKFASSVRARLSELNGNSG